ncbi:MAG: HesA/MoeB/ThiF family protein [Phycisphaerales bacterium JB039]
MHDTSRIRPSIDVEQMATSHAAIIGGAGGLATDLVRCGLGRLTLIDFDRIDSSNPARQDFPHTQIRRLKVEYVRDWARSINPDVQVDILPRDFCELSEEEMGAILGPADLLINATDSFAASARGNKEALRLGLDSIWIGMYAGGRAGEIVFSDSQRTLACYRCICDSRYRAFEEGHPPASSVGGTILDLRLVDAIAGQIAIGLLTRGAANRFGRLIDGLGARNLIQVKIDPGYTLNGRDPFTERLGASPAHFSFTSMALEMTPDPECPDCAAVRQEAGAHP